ncbi:MAG: hypothetical protein WDM77_01095 [Steroidobacteraceae bacterium]
MITGRREALQHIADGAAGPFKIAIAVFIRRINEHQAATLHRRQVGAQLLVAVSQFNPYISMLGYGTLQRVGLGRLHLDQDGAVLVAQGARGYHR